MSRLFSCFTLCNNLEGVVQEIGLPDFYGALKSPSIVRPPLAENKAKKKIITGITYIMVALPLRSGSLIGQPTAEK